MVKKLNKSDLRWTADELLFIRNQIWQQLKQLHHKIILSQKFDSYMEQIKVQRLNGNPSNNEVKIKSELIGNYERKPEAVFRTAIFNNENGNKNIFIDKFGCVKKVTV